MNILKNEIGFLFSSDYFIKNKPDSEFLDQYSALKHNKFNVFIENIDEIISGSLTEGLLEKNSNVKYIIYRGWMLTDKQYNQLERYLNELGYEMLINTEMYLKSHYIVNWYKEIQAYTPETIICSNEADAMSQIDSLCWDKYFIKDYVKSLKSGSGSAISLKIELETLLLKMKEAKGFIEGGICLRKFIRLIPNSEKRYFILNGKMFSPGKAAHNPKLLTKIMKLHDSFFYSVDIAQLENGDDIVIEIGDGQVSDLVGWDVVDFTNMWNEICL